MNSSSISSQRPISFETNNPVLDMFLTIYAIVIQSFMIFTNSVLLHVICWTPQLRENPTYLLILSLVVSDLLYAIGFGITIILYFLPLNPTPVLCLSFIFLLYCPMITSGLNFVVCLGDRYMKICHPFWYVSKMSRKYAIIISTVPWVITILASGITFIEVLPGELFNGVCPFVIPTGLVGDIIFLCFVTLALVMISFFIYGISNISRKQQHQVWSTTSARPKYTMHKRIAYLLSFSFVFYVPITIIVAIERIASLYETSASFRTWYQVGMAFSHLHFVLHSVVYGWKDKQLRYHVKKLFIRTASRGSEE